MRSDTKLKWGTGVAAALCCPYASSRFPGHQIFFASMVSFMVGNLLGALAPVKLTYWAITFPSFLLVAAGPGEGVLDTHPALSHRDRIWQI